MIDPIASNLSWTDDESWRSHATWCHVPCSIGRTYNMDDANLSMDTPWVMPIKPAIQSRHYIETRPWINSASWIEFLADSRVTTSAPELWVWLPVPLTSLRSVVRTSRYGSTKTDNGKPGPNLRTPQSNSRRVSRWISRAAIMANCVASKDEV